MDLTGVTHLDFTVASCLAGLEVDGIVVEAGGRVEASLVHLGAGAKIEADTRRTRETACPRGKCLGETREFSD